MGGFLRYQFGGLTFGGDYFQNFTVCQYLQGFYNYKKINNIFLTHSLLEILPKNAF